MAGETTTASGEAVTPAKKVKTGGKQAEPAIDQGVTYYDPATKETKTVTGFSETPPPGATETSTGAKTTSGSPSPLEGVNSLGMGIDKILAPYMTDLSRLGPEYQQEMSYLAPYLTGSTNAATDQVVYQGAMQGAGGGVQQVNDTTPEAQELNAAEASQGAKILSQPAPGFGNVAQATKQYEQSLPYSQVLSTVLKGGQNEVLYGSTVPNLTNINAAQFPTDIQNVLKGLTSSVGVNPSTGLPSPATASIAAANNPNTTAPGNPSTP